MKLFNRNIKIVILLNLAVTGVSFFLFTGQAHAELVPLNRIPGNWTTGCRQFSAGQNWVISSRPTRGADGFLDYRNQNLNVTAGDTVPLEVVIYTTTCRPNDTYYPHSTGNLIRDATISGGATISGIDSNTIHISRYNSNVLAIDVVRIPITVRVPSSLPSGNHVFTVSILQGEKINRFRNGVYQCVEAGGNRSNYLQISQYNGCRRAGTNISFSVRVEARPTGNPTGAAQAHCSRGFQGWAVDTDNMNARLAYMIVINSGRPNERVITGTANQAIPQPPFNRADLAAFGIAGNRGFTVPVPSEFKNGSSHSYVVVVFNAPGTPSNGAPFYPIGTGTFRCDAPLALDTQITCNAQIGEIVYKIRNTSNVDGSTNATLSYTIDSGPDISIAVSNPVSIARMSEWTHTERDIELDAGQNLRARIAISPNAGGQSPREVDCGTRSANPYFKVYGGDVIVGSVFPGVSGACTAVATPPGIRANSSASGGGHRGASTQLAAHALGQINGFYSANLRSGQPNANQPDGLTFGNTASPGGRDSSGAARCMPDYFAIFSNLYGVDSSSGFTLSGAVPNADNILVVEGDLTITNNVPAGGLSWSSIEDIKPNYVIVKGNINIRPNVTEINGLFVAQGGTINTCAPLNAGCRSNNLVINGAFIANKVDLRRVGGNVAAAGVNEDVRDGSGNIAETFNFTPELYFPFFDPTTSNNPLPAPADSIVGLPPVL